MRQLLLLLSARLQLKRDVVSKALEQSRLSLMSAQEAFRMRMQQQCQRIGLYRQAVLKETGRLLTPDEAALEWIARYAASFDKDYPIK